MTLIIGPQDYEIHSINSIRNNQDISINDYGQLLLDLCIAAKLRILNGNTGEISKKLFLALMVF